MADEKDRFGETMKLVERAKEDIYFSQRDRELIEKLKAQLQKVGCQNCGGIWMDKGELEAIIRQVSRGPLGHWIDKLVGKEGQTKAKT
jgi:hypothetical protein